MEWESLIFSVGWGKMNHKEEGTAVTARLTPNPYQQNTKEKGDVCSMAQKTGYEVEGNVVTTLKEVSELLGEKVTKADLQEGGKFADQVGIVDLSDADTTEDENWDNEPMRTEPEQEKHPMEQPNVNPDEVYTALTAEDMKNLESVDPDEIKSAFPEFEDIDELKEFIKDIDTPTLEYLATGLGLEWNPTYHKNIHRMRIAMEIQKHFFPELFKPKDKKGKKAKYGDYDTDTLFKMAEDGKVEVKRSGNDPIDRMRVIMKLKDAGILAE